MSIIDIAHKGLWLASKAKTEPFTLHDGDLCPTDWGQDDHRSNVALAYRNRERADQFYHLDTDRLTLCAHALTHYAELCRAVLGNSAALAGARAANLVLEKRHDEVWRKNGELRAELAREKGPT